MYEVRVCETICIAHRVLGPDGELGNLHGHNWTVELHVGASRLDPTGRVAPTASLSALLHRIVDPIDHRTLDDLAPFQRAASRTAPAFAGWVASRVGPELGPGVTLTRVVVRDGTGGMATFVPEETR